MENQPRWSWRTESASLGIHDVLESSLQLGLHSRRLLLSSCSHSQSFSQLGHSGSQVIPRTSPDNASHSPKRFELSSPELCWATSLAPSHRCTSASPRSPWAQLLGRCRNQNHHHRHVARTKGMVRVFCRMRPLGEWESEGVVPTPPYDVVVLSSPSQRFSFDKVFREKASQEEVFKLLHSALDGKHKNKNSLCINRAVI